VICSENHVSVCECLHFLDMKEVLSSLSGLLLYSQIISRLLSSVLVCGLS
jgi:hypothetical protein